MKMRIAVLTALALTTFAAAGVAEPMITGVSPSEGPTRGRTVVTITGVGFDPETHDGKVFAPEVYFGELRAVSEIVVDGRTIVAITPAHLSGAVYVLVKQLSGTATAWGAFTYVGNDADGVRRFLLPIHVAPVHGAFGSEFRSDLQILNPSRWLAIVNGLYDDSGAICLCIPGPLYVRPGGSSRPGPAGSPGRFIEVANDPAETLAMNLRVYDTSRAGTNLGTEIPVVPSSAFRTTIELPGIPNDPRFRLTLRVYGNASPQSLLGVRVTFAGQSSLVQLRPPKDAFDPAYAELPLTVPAGVSAPALALKVESALPLADYYPPMPIWAFVTVTNNETQHITTITPQPMR